MKRSKNGSTLKQYAYARRLLNGQATNKQEAARLSGFSPSVAKNVKAKVEDTVGFQNAVLRLAEESNNLVLQILTEYKLRGLRDFTNKDLNGALNAISTAWDRINKQRAPNKNQTPEGNQLRRALIQKIENQTINMNPAIAPTSIVETNVEEVVEDTEEEDDPNDF